MPQETNLPPSRRAVLLAGGALAAVAWRAMLPPAVAAATHTDSETFTQNEILQAAEGFFGTVSQALAELIERVFKEQGRPNGYITGEEASGALGVGLRYGQGRLRLKNGGRRRVFWQGPSIGFDVGGNASKAFTLAYGIRRTEQIFQRFPGVDGSLYYVAGFSVNYQKSGSITLAPIRTGVGLRAGVSIGYLHYTREHSWIPL